MVLYLPYFLNSPFFLQCDKFLKPALPFNVVQTEQFCARPVEARPKIGYLLVDLFQRVAYDPPRGGTSASKA